MNSAIRDLYILALDLKADINEAPIIWKEVALARPEAYKNVDDVIPGYIKLIMEYGIKWIQ